MRAVTTTKCDTALFGVWFRPLDIVVRPGWVLALVLVWSYFFNSIALSALWLTPALLVLVFALQYLYRSDALILKLSGTDLLALLLFLSLNLCIHWAGLFSSLGGDELYHAGRATFALNALRDSAPVQNVLAWETYRASIWRLFALEHLAVPDLWRLLSFGVVLLLCGLALISRVFRQWPASVRAAFGLCLLSLCAWGGAQLALPAEDHPPLRLLPLFSSAVLFGLNSFAFRLPSVVTVSLVNWVVYRMLAQSSAPRWWCGLVAAATSFIPVVFYVAEAVEASVYGYAVCSVVLLVLLQFLRNGRLELLVCAGLLSACGVLLRQTTMILWLPIFIVFLASKWRFNFGAALRVFAPGLVTLPYLFSLSQLGHTATRVQGSVLERLQSSVANGVGVMSVLNSTTLPWFSLLVVLFLYCLWRRVPVRELSLLLMVIPSYCLFHMIWPYLWGLGRYQAEYVAPFIVLLLVLAAPLTQRVERLCGTAVLIFLTTLSIELNSNLSLDINYAEWPRMRITTSASFPYRQALNYLKRQEVRGDFVILGGSPWYNEMPLWLSGHSFAESRRWREQQSWFDAFAQQPRDTAGLHAALLARGIKHLVVQSGTRREVQHRSAAVDALIVELERVALTERVYFYKRASYEGEHGGILSIYAPRQ